MDKVIAYCDGCCKGNPGKGGWGAHLSYKGTTKEIYGGEPETTNNRMELLAAIKTLEALKASVPIVVFTDSQYVKNGITTWIKSWKVNSWRGSNKKPVKNVDLWKRLDNLCENIQVEWMWVEGHAGDAGNELADKLANKGVCTI